ncbi:uncharacterized protein LOC129922667 [Biomphalaria glabrata]|uniref:Uncharacterized protein LOC129922667 n=1 Tax=Biomphalaria glabrata TaxID=6526 RepID=A0A9W2YRH1_BIOGL|nr:uncharacterized protein LOC129922667 [Biomphalaria glabrata]
MEQIVVIGLIFISTLFADSVSVPCLNDISQISVNGKCFKVFKNTTNWNGAQGFCIKNFYNGKLAEPITQNELNAIYKLVDVVRNGALNFITWIGANDLEVEGHFVWASDNSTLNPALWGKSTPDNWLNPYTNERENCVSLFVNENSTRLNDASCSLNYSLICQSDPCDTYLPGSLFSDSKCYKYYNYDLTWEKAQQYCLYANSHLAEPYTDTLQVVINSYLYNRTAWIGGRNKDCSSTFKWFVSESIVSSNFTNFTTFVKGSCLNTSLLWNNVVNTSSWKARNELETHAFVCEKAITSLNTRIYLALLPSLSKTSPQWGHLQATTNFSDMIYVRFKSSNNSENVTILPLTPTFKSVRFIVDENLFLTSSDVYYRYVRVNSTQPVTVVLYIMDQTRTSTTLVYPEQIYFSNLFKPTSYLPLSALSQLTADDMSLTVSSESLFLNNITLILNNWCTPTWVMVGTMSVNLNNVENITVNQLTLYQTLNLNLHTNLDRTYLYSTQPVKVSLGTIGLISNLITYDSTLEEMLPISYIGTSYVGMSALLPGTQTKIKLQAVYNWTLINIISSSNSSVVLSSIGDTYELLINKDTAYSLNGNKHFYAYQINSRKTGTRQDMCVTSLLSSNVWRYEYDFVRVSANHTVYIYIFAEMNVSSDIVTSDESVRWTCRFVPGTRYMGCTTVLSSSVTYLHIELANRQRPFGADVLGYGPTSSFCHPMGIADVAQSLNLEPFQHDSYLQSLQDRDQSICSNVITTTYSISTSSDLINYTTSSVIPLETTSEVTPTDAALVATPSVAVAVATTAEDSIVSTSSDLETIQFKSTTSTSTTKTSPKVTTRKTSPKTTQSIRQRIDALVSYLKLDYHKLSSYKRTLISVSDTRISPKVFAGIGMFLVLTTVAMLSYKDLVKIGRYFKTLCKTKSGLK